jgi:hypothetical protein
MFLAFSVLGRHICRAYLITLKRYAQNWERFLVETLFENGPQYVIEQYTGGCGEIDMAYRPFE